MRTRTRTHRLSAASAAVIVGLVILPLVVAFADEPARPAAGRPAVVRGRVTDEAGKPLADARVRVAIPAADMRFVHPGSPEKQREARTDARGEYRLEFPEITGRTKISIDAMKPGYRRLVGTLMQGGDPKDVEVGPGDEVEAALVLRPAIYFAGVVVDDRGKPISGVSVSANADTARTSGGIERTASGPDGSFELFNYSAKPFAVGGEPSRWHVFFAHPDYVDASVPDLYAIVPEKRRDVRVVMETGFRLAGTVLDSDGKLVPMAMVEAVLRAGSHRRATLTDADGRFALRGLSPGLTELTVRALAIHQEQKRPMAVNGDKSDLEIRLRPIELPAGLARYSVLGMQLADVTPELKSAYDLYNSRGALILDPGRDSGRLKIGELAEGNVFWMVGSKRVGSVREFVDQLIAEAGGQDLDEYSIRVVYSFRAVEFVGTNTQYIKLTRDDLKQLKALSDRLRPEDE